MTENELKPVQVKVAELLTQGESVTSAAALVGCTRQSIHRWLNDDPAFIDLVASLTIDQIEATRNRIKSEAYRAVGVIVDLMDNSSNDAVRLSAAKELLAGAGAL
ncbi:MAG: hypothetical protein QX190_05300 [Methylococcales bacterium]|jgi:hypothetical protein